MKRMVALFGPEKSLAQLGRIHNTRFSDTPWDKRVRERNDIQIASETMDLIVHRKQAPEEPQQRQPKRWDRVA